MPILKLLENDYFSPKQLYTLLCSESGLGAYFVPNSSVRLVNEAFQINAETQSVTIREAKKLFELADHFKRRSEEQDAIEKSLAEKQYVLCLAVLCNTHATIATVTRETSTGNKQPCALNLISDSERAVAFNQLAEFYNKESNVTPNNAPVKSAINKIKAQLRAKLFQQFFGAATPNLMAPSAAAAACESKMPDAEQRPGINYEAYSFKVINLLEDMQDKGLHETTKKRKADQCAFFVSQLKHLNSAELKQLTQLMENVQQNRGNKMRYFTIIRAERFSIWGGGNTDTWQAMRSAVKSHLLRSLPKENYLDNMTEDNYKVYTRLFSQHSGRWYGRWGNAESLDTFKKLFPEDAVPKTPKPS